MRALESLQIAQISRICLYFFHLFHTILSFWRSVYAVSVAYFLSRMAINKLTCMMQLCTSDSCRQQNNLQLDVALLQNNLGFTCVTFRCVTMVIRLCTRSKMFAFMSPDPTLLYGQRCDFTRRSPDGVHGVSIHLRAHRCRSSSCVTEMSPSVCENIDACPKV